MPDIERAVNWAVGIANDDSHGYAQDDRDRGVNFDCSSLVCWALSEGGFPLGKYKKGNSFSTGTMYTVLTPVNGWTKYEDKLPTVKRGDILWRSGHTAIAVSSTDLVEARMNEKGTITGGKSGDQTGSEIHVRKINASGYIAFTRIWRYNAGAIDTSQLTVDGLFGTTTVKRWQQVMGVVADGIISGQYSGNKQYHQASAAIQYGSGGSSLVRAVQTKLGITADGQLGPNTIKAIQKHLGVTADGYFAAKPAETVKALQRRLNTGTF